MLKPVTSRLIKASRVTGEMTFQPDGSPWSELGIFWKSSGDKQVRRLSLMSTVQRLFNDFPQISGVGVVEIIAAG